MKHSKQNNFIPQRRNTTYSNRPSHAARSAHARGDKKFRTYDTSYIQPKRGKVSNKVAAIIAVIIILVLVIFAITQIANCSNSNTVANGAEVNIVIEEGEGGNEIANKLATAGLVANANDFKRALTDSGQSANLKAGSYVLTGGMSANEIVSELVSGPVAAQITVPEGNTLDAISLSVATASGGRITQDQFSAQAAAVDTYRAAYPAIGNATTLEGFLFPKTYNYSKSDTADTLIKAMLDQYNTETAALNYSYPESRGLSKYDVLILASIIEKESDANTREKVSAVFYNRLFNSDSPDAATGFGYLQSDATTAYYVGHDPTGDEVHANNEYSTYTNSGLPPTPICNPGVDALRAACNPDTQAMNEGYYFFYFAPDSNGNMQYYFSKTLEEHNAAIAANS